MILDQSDHCEYCHPDVFKRVALAKQNALFAYLDNRKDLPPPFSSDRMVEGGACGKERPDRIYDGGDKIIVVECDEHQHRERACECEQTRMVNIGQLFGGVPVYFLRWNPDDYTAESRAMPEALPKRYKLLGDLIRDMLNNTMVSLPKALVSALYLYYDGWNGLHNETWKVLTPF